MIWLELRDELGREMFGLEAEQAPKVGESLSVDMVGVYRSDYEEDFLAQIDVVLGRKFRVMEVHHLFRWRPRKTAQYVTVVVKEIPK